MRAPLRGAYPFSGNSPANGNSPAVRKKFAAHMFTEAHFALGCRRGGGRVRDPLSALLNLSAPLLVEVLLMQPVFGYLLLRVNKRPVPIPNSPDDSVSVVVIVA